MRPIDAQRRQALADVIEQKLSAWLEVLPGAAGLHLTARIRELAFVPNVTEAAREHLPGALPLTAYMIGKSNLQGLCIGYGCVEVEHIVRAVREMARALRG